MEYAFAREAMKTRVQRKILGVFFFIFIVKLKKSQVRAIILISQTRKTDFSQKNKSFFFFFPLVNKTNQWVKYHVNIRLLSVGVERIIHVKSYELGLEKEGKKNNCAKKDRKILNKLIV